MSNQELDEQIIKTLSHQVVTTRFVANKTLGISVKGNTVVLPDSSQVAWVSRRLNRLAKLGKVKKHTQAGIASTFWKIAKS